MYKKLFTVTILIIIILLAGCNNALTSEPVNNSVAISESPTPVASVQASEKPVLTPDIPEKIDIEEKLVPVEEARTLTILVTGDNLFHIDNLASAYDEESDTYDFFDYYQYVKPYVQSADLAIANFESVTAGREAVISSFPQFNTPDEILPALKDTGFDVLITANNHCLDRGYDGLVRTIEKINENGMQNVGTYLNEEIRWTDTIVDGIVIRNLAYTFSCNGNIYKLSDDQLFMVNMLDESLIKQHIDRAKEEGVDLINVFLHWGTEYILEPAAWQEDFAKRLFKFGADIIFATHPHVIQKSAVYDINGENKYIIYSTGNFISNFSRNDTANRGNKIYTEDGVMVEATFIIGSDNQLTLDNVFHIPTWPYKFYVDGKPAYRIIPIQDIETLHSTEYTGLPDVEYMLKEAEASYHRTFERVENYSFREME